MEAPRQFPWWQDPRTVIALGGACLLLALALLWTGWRWGIAEDRMEMMAAQAAEGFLRPPSSTRSLRIEARSAPRAIQLDAGTLPVRYDLAIAMVTDRYERFRLDLAREDGTAVLQVDRVVRDSRGDLRLGLNSTLLPNGHYRLRIEGVTWRGDTVPLETVRLQVSGR